MRVSKFLSIIFLITNICLLYVYQQTEIFRLAYEGQKKQALSQESLDKNTILRYNISSSASLVEIGSRLSGYTELEMPDTYRLVRLESSPERLGIKGKSPKRQTILSRFFSVKRQAEARPINP
jgi:hypothetical protein